MAGIALPKFFGELPRVDPHHLPAGYAVSAVNVDLRAGALVPFRSPSVLFSYPSLTGLPGILRENPARVIALRRGSQRAFVMFGDPNGTAFLGPVSNDTTDLVYLSTSINGGTPGGLNGPQYAPFNTVHSGGPLLRLGVPSGPQPTVIASGGSGTTVTRVYVATWLTGYGEEGVPGPSVSVSGKEDGTWTVQGYPSVKPSEFPNNIKAIRIYRGTQANGLFKFVRQVDLPPDPDWTPSFTDTVSEASLAIRVGPPLEAFAPPQNLANLTRHPNGFLLGTVGRDIYMSIPFLPYAWPPSYVVRLPAEVMTLRVVGDSVIALTKVGSFALIGTSPLNIGVIAHADEYPCISSRSAVVWRDKVIYASHAGLVEADVTRANLFSASIVTPEQWESSWATPNMQAVVWNDSYFAMNGRFGFMLSLQNDSGLVRVQLPFTASSLDVLGDDGRVVLTSGTTIREWAPSKGSSVLSYRWMGGPLLTDRPRNFAAYTVKIAGDQATSETPGPDDDTSDLAAFNAQAFPSLTLALGMVGLPGPVQVSGAPPGRPLPPAAPLAAGGLYRVLAGADVDASDGLTVTISAGSQVIYDEVYSSESPRKLPSGFKDHRWSVGFAGKIGVAAFSMAETGRELGNAV